MSDPPGGNKQTNKQMHTQGGELVEIIDSQMGQCQAPARQAEVVLRILGAQNVVLGREGG